MTGMFQSSRIASGSPRLQASNAFSPSSASVIWNSMPSRMRRATFRMTLESSTTKQLFITCYSLYVSPNRRSCSNGTVSDFQHAIDIEHDHQLPLESIDAASHAIKPRIEIGRFRLTGIVPQHHHLANRIDQKPIGLAIELDADRHHRRALGPRG